MLLDVNILIYAIDSSSDRHEVARAWMADALTGESRVGFPWQTVGGFLRMCTHPRVFDRPLTGWQAWGVMDGWLASPVAWIPAAGASTVRILRQLMADGQPAGPRVTDMQLAALALEYSVPVVSADTDFQRFAGVTWVNPFE